jgi:hypothetical protein
MTESPGGAIMTVSDGILTPDGAPSHLQSQPLNATMMRTADATDLIGDLCMRVSSVRSSESGEMRRAM